MLTRHALHFTSCQTYLTNYGIQAIELDPSSHKGYERKHAALHGMGRYREAFDAFETMLSKLEQASDPCIRGKPFF